MNSLFPSEIRGEDGGILALRPPKYEPPQALADQANKDPK